ncbi:hypothetical protein [Paraclostridium sordellii]|uniref:hypothetical protein n=1 Tax=Paraclostridium sordellii TaxID=1505 RepID=UPI0005E5BB30|nr:hypothetical protein [Paeniclostridium sordellii]CEQ26780.1 Uncharacterised protein [[Clostridium] sordellii] [Paeniclostridium sordellii]
MGKIYDYGSVVKDLKIKLTLEEYKDNITDVTSKQIEFARGIIERVFNFEDDELIDVNYNRCGLGKSTLIKCILHNLVNDSSNLLYKNYEVDNYGAIVVTDRLDRLTDIQNYKNLKDRCYYMKYDQTDEISYKYSRVEFKEQLTKQFKYPIVLLSTQKYFKMTKDERNQLYKWAGGDRKIKFIDEKPYIMQTYTIDESYLTEINVALERLPKGEDKDFLIDYWKKIYNKFDNLRNLYTKYDCNWISGNGKSELLNVAMDKQFVSKLKEYVSKKIYEDVIRLKDVSERGCLFIASNDKDKDNTRQFVLIENNIEKFDTDKCKNIIFDATARLDIHYTISNKFKLFKEDDSKECDINLHNIQVSTSQKSLKKNKNLIKTISTYINEVLDKDILVATYSQKSGLFQEFKKNLHTEKLIYFGDIKGKNNWKDRDCIVHCGLNRKPSHVYLETYIALTDIYKEFNKINDADVIYNRIQEIILANNGLFTDFKMNKIMRSDIIVDTIQNLMRIKCRHFSNTKMCQVYLICSKTYEDIVNGIGKEINAKVIKCRPPIFNEMKTMERKPVEGKDKTNPQILLEYLKSIENGTVLRMKDIIYGSGLNRDQIKECRKSNDSIIEWFNNHQGSKKGQYIV